MKPFFLTYFSLCFFTAYANDGSSLGARLAALGNASTAVSDVWSIQHNQAGMAYLENTSFAISVENRFGLKELNLGGAIAVVPTKVGVFGLSISHMGDELFSQSNMGVAYAKKLGRSVSAGLQFNYSITHLGNEYGISDVLLVEGGLQAKFRYTLFETADYDSRIYAYEPDVLYAFSVPAHYGSGQRYVLLVKYRFHRKFSAWIRFSETAYFDRNTVKSGLEEVDGNKLTEVKVLLRYKF